MDHAKSRGARARWRRRALVAAGMAGTMVLVQASPALAAQGFGDEGSGTYSITATRAGANPPCSKVTAFSWAGTFPSDSFYTATDENGITATYTGTVASTLTFTGTQFYEGPAGTYGTTDSTCAGTAGATIPVSATVDGTGPNGDVSCTYTGTYRRLSTEDQTTIAQLGGTCTVTDSGNSTKVVSNSATHETRVGNLGTCTGGFPPSSCASVNDQYAAQNN